MSEVCIPLEMIKNVSLYYPNIWNRLEKVREQNINGELWDKRCYIPITSVFDEIHQDISDFKNSLQYMEIIAALAAWRIHKQIFVFDADLEKLLINQRNQDLVLPVETLYNLPYDCIYIRPRTVKNIDGFFVRFEYWKAKIELKFLIAKLNGSEIELTPAVINLIPGKTIKELINASFVMNEEGKFDLNNFPSAQEKNRIINMVNSLLQLVLYLCSQNSEVTEDPEQKKFRKPPKSFEFIKDKPREIQKWNCGEETGEMIRKYQNNPKQYYDYEDVLKHSGNGTPKSPHARRGHWHSYWTGKRGSSDRKVILKWLAPMFIHKIMEEEAKGITTNIVDSIKNKDNNNS